MNLVLYGGKFMKTIFFGNYWQSNSKEKEPIEWLVLKEEEYSSLLTALDVLTSHNNLNINLDIFFLLGLDSTSLSTLLESTLLTMSINELLINSSYKTIIANLETELKKVKPGTAIYDSIAD